MTSKVIHDRMHHISFITNLIIHHLLERDFKIIRINKIKTSTFHFFTKNYRATTLFFHRIFNKIADWIKDARMFLSKQGRQIARTKKLIARTKKLTDAIKQRDPVLVKKLLEKHKFDMSLISTDLLNALFERNGVNTPRRFQYEILELLIQHKIVLHFSTTSPWATDIICYAAETNNLEIFKLFLSPPVTRDQLIIREIFFTTLHHRESRSFLHFAMQNKNYPMVDFLLEIGLGFGTQPYSQQNVNELVAFKKETRALLYNPLHTVHRCFPQPIVDIITDYLVPDYAPSTRPNRGLP